MGAWTLVHKLKTNMKLLFKIKLLVLGFLLAAVCSAGVDKPNVIFILMDDMGYSDVSCYGATKVSTPHIDRMAAEGMQFTDFHTGASICSPSRAAFMTGAYPQRNGLYMGINPKREAHWFLGLNPDEDEEFLWIAEEALCAPLPAGWTEHMRQEYGAVYYFNAHTQESSWSKHPPP